MKKFGIALLFLVIGILTVPVCAWIYLNYGHPPVAVADPSFPMEAQIVHRPLNKRIESELATSPITLNEAALTEGAGVYMNECAFCHGTPGKDSKVGANMFPGRTRTLGETSWRSCRRRLRRPHRRDVLEGQERHPAHGHAVVCEDPQRSADVGGQRSAFGRRQAAARCRPEDPCGRSHELSPAVTCRLEVGGRKPQASVVGSDMQGSFASLRMTVTG